jgi:hypothetical protein
MIQRFAGAGWHARVIRSPSKNGAVRSYWREWRLTALSVGPGPAESVMGPMEKWLTVVRFRSGLSYRGAPRWILRLSGIRRTISSSRSRRGGLVRLQQGSKTPRQADMQRQRDVISMSHRSDRGGEHVC